MGNDDIERAASSDAGNAAAGNGSLEEAAEQGPLPGAVEAEQAAERGEDTSEVDDPEIRSEQDGADTVPGGINMR